MGNKFPSQLFISDVSITNYHRVYSTESISGIQYRRDSGVQWYKGEVTLNAYGYENVKRMNGFLAGLKGKLNAFELPLGGAYSNPDLAQNPYLQGGHNIGSNTISVYYSGVPIPQGSVFTVPNETKLYTVLEDIVGDGVYSITPSFRIEHVNLEEVNFINPVITALLDENETTITHEGNGKLASASISWTEAL